MADKNLEKILQFINENKADDSLEIREDSLLSLFSAFAEELSQSGQLKLEELGTFHFLSGGSGLSKKVSFIPSKEIKFLLGDTSALGAGDVGKKKETFIPQTRSDQQHPLPVVSQPDTDQKELIVWTEAETDKKEEQLFRSEIKSDQKISNNTQKNENVVEVREKNAPVTSSDINTNNTSEPSQQKKDTSFSEDQERIEKRRKDRIKKIEKKEEEEISSGSGQSKFIGSFLILALMAVLVIFFIWYKSNRNPISKEKDEVVIEFSDSVKIEKEKPKEKFEQNSIYVQVPADTTDTLSDNEDSSQLVITTEKNSNLLELAKKYYGSDVFWVYIYLENKGIINDPVNLPNKVKLKIPKPDKNLMDANNPTCIKKANDLAVQILKY